MGGGVQVVDHDDLVTRVTESVDQVGPDEAGATGHHDAAHRTARSLPR